MKKTIPVLLLFIIATQFITAQISPNVLKKYPAHILFKLNEVTSVVAINEEKQIQIATEILKKDNLANAGLAKGETVEKVQQYYTLDRQFLNEVLSQDEVDRYYSQQEPNNRLLLALATAKQLSLDPNQVLALRKQNDILEATKSKDDSQKNEFYTQKLDSILTKKQKGALLATIYRKESNDQTNKDWNNILKYNLATAKDSSLLRPKLFRYNLIKNSVLDPKINKTNTKKQLELKDKLALELQPDILNHYAILAQEGYKKNLFSLVIPMEKQLSLTSVQIDSLLANYKRLELLKLKNNKDDQMIIIYTDYIKFENEAIARLLDPKQLTDFLLAKNRVKSRKTAVNDWTSLEKQNLTTGLDKLKTLNEFASYHLNAMIADERIKISRNRLNLFVKRDIELKKPELLKQLDIIKQTENNAKSAKNDLKW